MKGGDKDDFRSKRKSANNNLVNYLSASFHQLRGLNEDVSASSPFIYIINYLKNFSSPL